MERARVVKAERIEQDRHLLALCVETKNSCLILLSESEDKLGTLAIAVPRQKDMLGSPLSSVLLGDKNAISARMFAEYVAGKREKISLVSVYLETVSEIQAQPFFRELIEKVVSADAKMEGGRTAA